MKITVKTEEDLVPIAASWVDCLALPLVIYLQGDLGVGKTTFVRHILRALGFEGKIKSPTYTLVEQYETLHGLVIHIDLYRIKDPEELAFLGLDELISHPALWFIEWPEQGGELMPPSDVVMRCDFDGDGRMFSLQGKTSLGESFIEKLRAKSPS